MMKTMHVETSGGPYKRMGLRKAEDDKEAWKPLKLRARISFNGLYDRANPEMTKKMCTIGRPENRRRKKGEEPTLSPSSGTP